MNLNSAMYWFPKIEKMDGIFVPRTIIVPYQHINVIRHLEEPEDKLCLPYMQMLKEEIRKACVEIGYPCFCRTDLASAKHSGPDAYLIKSDIDISRVIYRTAEDNELKFWPRERPMAFMIREYLTLDYDFVAFRGLPIAREWRFFTNEATTICFHPYWPEDAITFHKEELSGWKDSLRKMHIIEDSVKEELCYMAKMAAGLCGGTWSVDFAMTDTKKWYLIDMALAERSWHWPSCKNYKEKGDGTYARVKD